MRTKATLSSFNTIRTFLKVGTWSETILTVVDGSYGTPHPPEEHAAAPLAGGILGMGFQCGQVWGAALAAGAQAYQQLGPDPRAEIAAVLASQRLVDSFHGSYQSINCRDVTQMDLKNIGARQVFAFFLKGGAFRCFAMTAGYARAASAEIHTALTSGLPEVEPPISCAAVLARKTGASDQHAVMAAGLAGGIGLSGSVCGVLGAAIWLHALRSRKESFDLTDPESMGIIDQFVEITGIQFECSEITGRRFADVHEHAGYLCEGGCAKIINGLADAI